MIDLIKQFEAVPAAYPDAPTGLSTEAASLDADMIWARIEAYTAHRYTPREIVWTVEGAGDWMPPIIPVNTITAEVWESGQWSDTTLQAGPYGYCLIGDGPYRIVADVGGGDVPAPVSGAFMRLAEYLADDPGTAGASSTSISIGPIEESLNRAPIWLARAMQYSGAGDLLRQYRRA
jgi:hypothetical protein